MIEILWHGRGGQGAFTAARLLGAAASMNEGLFALAFPSFGPERRGAPMRAFTKIATSPIGDRSAIEKADFVIYLDETLFAEEWEHELKPGGMVLVNSAQDFEDSRVCSFDANGIAMRCLGRPIPNTAFLGALSVLCEALDTQSVIEAIRQYMPAKLHEKNERVVQEACACIESLLAAGEISPAQLEDSDGAAAKREKPIDAASGAGSGFAAAAHKAALLFEEASAQSEEPLQPIPYARGRIGSARCAHIPVLREQFSEQPSLDPRVYARTTAYPAGHLVSKNAGWRNVRPVIHADACTGCLQCYLYCPDGTVCKCSDDASGKAAVSIDLDFCKGCGICAKVCKFNAIEMVAESEVNA